MPQRVCPPPASWWTAFCFMAVKGLLCFYAQNVSNNRIETFLCFGVVFDCELILPFPLSCVDHVVTVLAVGLTQLLSPKSCFEEETEAESIYI